MRVRKTANILLKWSNYMKPRTDPSTKPYYKCLSCPTFRQDCAGLPTRDMSLQEWCEYIRDVSDAFHLSNAYIASQADVSIKTVERIEAVNCDKDIMRSTARRIEIVVLGAVGNPSCRLDHDPTAASELINQIRADLENLDQENKRYQKIIDKLLDFKG